MENQAETIEFLASAKLAEMDEKDVQKLVSKERSSWSRGQVETLKIDRITTIEAKALNENQKIKKLAVMREIVDKLLKNEISRHLHQLRGVPYQVSERGIRVPLLQYNRSKLIESCKEKGFEFNQDLSNLIGYISVPGKKNPGNMIPVIKPVLEECKAQVEE